MGPFLPPVPEILTIPSTCPADDAAYLQATFPRRMLRVEQKTANENDDNDTNGSKSLCLLGDDGGLVVFLVCVIHHTPPILPSIWWTETTVHDSSSAADDDSSQRHPTDAPPSTLFRDLCLPGGATIRLVPSALVSTDVGRFALLSHLQTTPSRSDKVEQQDQQPTPLFNVSGTSNSQDSTTVVVESVRLPTFPSLSVKLLEADGRRKPLPLNARQPINFKTNLFHGKILMVARPPNPAVDDPYWNERIFSVKKRRLIIQIQGRFQRQPRGVVYAGAEVSDPMKLGLLTRGLCMVLLKLVESFNKNIHSSFGDAELREHPHIVAPAYTFFERIVATPPGEIPPSMDEAFDESPESIAQRKKTTSVGEWNTTDTYSFSFYSMYIDLPTWKLVGLPASGDLSLETFWGQSMLRICMYEKSGSDAPHWSAENRYAFSVQMKYLGKHGSADIDDEYSSDEEDDRNVMFWSERPLPSLALRQPPRSPQSESLDTSESQYILDLTADGEEDLHFFDAFESQAEQDGDTGPVSQNTAPLIGATPSRPLELPTTPLEMLLVVDSKCPFWVDVYSGTRGGGYVKGYAVNVGQQTTIITERTCEEFINNCSTNTNVRNATQTYFSPRLSSSEQLRRSLGLTLLSESIENVAAWQNTSAKLSSFLRRARSSPSKGFICGFVARALSDRHWVEEYAYVNSRCIAFHRSDKRQPEFILPLSSVTKVQPLVDSKLQLGHPVWVLTSLGRSVYLMFPTDSIASEWCDIIEKRRFVAGQNDTDSISSVEYNALRLVEFECSTDEFLHKSTMWNCKNRKILNCGKFHFRQHAAPSSLLMAEGALQAALASDTLNNAEQRRTFLDSAAELKVAAVHDLDETSRLAFFLNVYHTMIFHSFLVLGPPDSSLQWIGYFNNVAYQVGDDIFSLSELEHCIIRAKMSFPGQFLSRFVIPKSVYAMALSTVDFRINFALNCGSLSNPSKVVIYKAEELDEQLNNASRLYLSNVTYRRNISGDLELKLPKMCQWFSVDFGHTKGDLLNSIERFLPSDVRKQLDGCRIAKDGTFDMSSCLIRFTTFKFECRQLSLEDSYLQRSI